MTRRKRAETVQDIFKSMGHQMAHRFIRDSIDSGMPADATPAEVEQALKGRHYHMHKDIPDYAALAVEKYNRRFC